MLKRLIKELVIVVILFTVKEGLSFLSQLEAEE